VNFQTHIQLSDSLITGLMLTLQNMVFIFLCGQYCGKYWWKYRPYTADIGKSIAITFFMKYRYWYWLYF